MFSATPLRLAVLALGWTAAFSTSATSAVRVLVEARDKSEFVALRDSGLDVARITGAVFDLLVSPEELDELRARGYRVSVEDAGISRASRGGFLEEYTSYGEAVDELKALANAHPELTRLTTIGTSHEGRSIYALKISDHAESEESEPEVLFVGNHHAREVITVPIPLAIADSLLSNYGTDPRHTEWVDERETWIVPVLNPDGLVHVEQGALFWRKNRRDNGSTFGVDLNRNYDFEWGHDDNGSSPVPDEQTYRGPFAASEPEVAALQEFIDSREFVMLLSYHAFGNLLLWGPGYKPAVSEDEDIFRAFGEIATASNGYQPGNPASGTIYVTNGDTDDWAYHAPTHSKILALTPEIGSFSDFFNPPAARIPALVTEGTEIAWAALEYADRPGRLAPPGAPKFARFPPTVGGELEVRWYAPTKADTEVLVYELAHRTGPFQVTEGFEASDASFDLGGWRRSTQRARSGSFSLHSGSGDLLNRICLARQAYEVRPGDAFTFHAYYSIELDWDYAYAILSTDGGRSFVNLPGTGTSLSDPNGLNADFGITGSSGGAWRFHTHDLSDWVGQSVWLGFRYHTDGGVNGEGIYVDDVHPVREWTTSEIVSSSIATNSFVVGELDPGDHYFTVRGRDAEGDWGYPSPTAIWRSARRPTEGLAPGFALSTWPNPFREGASIRFHLPADGEHSLRVYDVAGRRVRTLGSGVLSGGAHEVLWDGRSDKGALLPSGVYFVALKAAGSETRVRAVLRR